MLSFTYVYFFESGHINGLRPIQIKKIGRLIGLDAGRSRIASPISFFPPRSEWNSPSLNAIAYFSDFWKQKPLPIVDRGNLPLLIAEIDSHRGGVVQVASQNLNRLAALLKGP
jgi:hypothetical protein